MRLRSALRLAVPLACTALAVAQEHALFLRLQRPAAEAPLVVAHRGASSDHPENTAAALRAAVRAGAEVVEFDVWQARCGTWVCMHDATVDRTTDAAAVFRKKEIRIDSLTLAEIGRLDAGSWRGPRFAGERVPTLEQALAAIGSAVPMVERKGGDAQALVAELRRLRAVDRVLVQAFDWEWLAAVHRAEPKLLLGALGSKAPTPERLAEAARTGARLMHWDHRTLDVDAAASIRAEGRLLCVYTVDPDLLLLGAAAFGCDLITTNVPGRLVALRERGLLRRAR